MALSTIYGLNLPVSNMKQILEKNEKQQSGIKSWKQLFGGATLGFNAQSDALTSDYSSAISQAYKTNFEQNASIMSGGLGQGYTKQAISMSRQELQNTYDKYIGEYATNLSAAAKEYGTETKAIDDALTERATNMTQILNYMRTYNREELSGSSIKPVGQEVPLNYYKEKGLDWMLYNENDTLLNSDKIAGSLRSEEELDKLLYNQDNSLTEKGTAFYDATLNATPQGYKTTASEDTRGFDKWLSDKDSKLREWFVGQDDFNYTLAGINRGTLNTLTGRESKDIEYESPKYDFSFGTKDVGYTSFVDNVKKTMKDTFKVDSVNELTNNLENKKYGSYDTRIGIPGTLSLLGVQRQTKDLNEYIKDYKKYSNTELTTFKSELNKLLGESVTEEFLSQYSKDIEDVSNQIKNFSVGISREEYAEAVNQKMNPSTTLKKYKNEVKRLQDMNFDKKMKKMYEDLQTFITKKKIQIDKSNKPSGY